MTMPENIALILTIAGVAVVIGLVNWFEWRGEVNSDREAFKKFMKKMDKKIDKLFERLGPAPVTRQSPLHLTELGEEMSEELSAKAWMGQISKSLLERVRGMSHFDIQELCFDYIKSMDMTLAQDKKVKQCAYEHGLPRDQVLDVLAIELRDMLLRNLDMEPMP